MDIKKEFHIFNEDEIGGKAPDPKEEFYNNIPCESCNHKGVCKFEDTAYGYFQKLVDGEDRPTCIAIHLKCRYYFEK